MPVCPPGPEIVFREAEFNRDYPGPMAQAAIDGKVKWVDLWGGQFAPSSNVEVIGQQPNGLKIGKYKVPFVCVKYVLMIVRTNHIAQKPTEAASARAFQVENCAFFTLHCNCES